MFAIASFEFRQRMKLLSTHVYFLMFFALAVLWMTAAGGLFKGAIVTFGNKVMINSPFALTYTITTLGYVGLVVVAAMMGRAIQQDFEYRLQDFFFTTPISKSDYLAGRFCGALLALIYVFSSIPLGAWLATWLPGLDASRIGPQHLGWYLMPFLTSILPNLFILGSIFFALAALTRRMLPVYVIAVLMLLGYLIAVMLAKETEWRVLAAWLDPFGVKAIGKVTEYWSIAERNSRVVPLQGEYLYNRLLWGGIALLIGGLVWWRFQRVSQIDWGGATPAGIAADTSAATSAETSAEMETGHQAKASHQAPSVGQASARALLLPLTWLNLRETVKNIYFPALTLAAVLMAIVSIFSANRHYGTTTYPVTYLMLEMTMESFGLFILVITTFYAGELVWREREAGIAQLFDVLPIPSWLLYLPKLLALIAIQAGMLLVLMLCGILTQISQGYYQFEFGLYFGWLFLYQWPSYIMLAVLSMALQILLNQKYVAYFLMIMYYMLGVMLGFLDFDHPMLLYAMIPGFVYSDMNGYGHYLPRTAWFMLYWGGASLVLATASLLFWVRGTNQGMEVRKQMARRAFSSQVMTSGLLGMLAFATGGGVLYYNFNILNEYQSNYARAELLASYERRYQRFATRPQPRITDVQLNVDLHPERRSIHVHGLYQLHNRSGRPIHEIFLQFAPGININKLQFGRTARLQLVDEKLGFYSWRLEEALPENGRLELRFEIEHSPRGRLGKGPEFGMVGNGSFVNHHLMPSIGYQPRMELQDERERREHKLPAQERKLERDDARGLANNYISNDADWINFETILSTSAEQTAIAPGRLIKTWSEHGRRYFHYKVEQPMLNFYAMQSGRYALKKDVWNDVALEIYYHPGHEYNLQRMLDSIKHSLNYYTTNFGPYQHKMVRIVEFPRYQRFAQSFPGTIPYSEGLGFIAQVTGQKDKEIDYPFYITAHEVAHQWWAHQVVGGDTRGTTVLTETLSQYSALMVMKKRYGEQKMRRFLSYELDKYLLGRAVERQKELPLGHNEDQPYIHYNKGALIMYQLQDVLGEDKVNQALREILQAHGGKPAPYPSASVLIQALRRVTSADMQYLLDDGFEQIVLYENRALQATARRLPSGMYELKLDVEARKLQAAALGEEHAVAMRDYIDIGADDKEGRPILRQRHVLTGGKQSFSLLLKALPERAGIDPDNKLIDRKPNDNLIKVEER